MAEHRASGSANDRVYERYVSTSDRAPFDSRGADECFRSRAPYLKRLIAQHFGSNMRATVVDLGCGDGGLIYFARRAGFAHAVGVDHSKEQVALARRLGVSGITHGSVHDFLKNTPARSVDIVVAFDVLEHLQKDALLAMVDEVRRVLRPGGRWIVHVPNGASPFFGRVRYGDFTHELAFTAQSLRQLLLSSGFTTVECFEDRPVVHGVASLARFALWKVVRATLQVALIAENGGTAEILSQNLLAVATL